MRKLGLIGKNISYSFSKQYFESKFQKLELHDVSYTLFDLPDITAVEDIFRDDTVLGFNVTIPYKQKIITFLDELSEEAQMIGAVNCVKIIAGKKIGYNTDAFGFEKTLDLYRKKRHRSALILGNGGAAKAVQFVLHKKQIPYHIISRQTDLNFKNISDEMVKNHLLIIHCTPVGTYPNVEDTVPFPFDAISDQHLVIDLIYNPEESRFLRESAARKAKTVNGFYMLEQQAEKAWEIWEVQKK